MNVFRVLGINYEVFHSRMLLWLFTPSADHGAGNRFLRRLFDAIELELASDATLAAEHRVDVPGASRWRLADVMIRTPSHLVLVENKVDQGYHDRQQIEDEIIGGRHIAENEGRQFKLVLVAPGPIPAATNAVIETTGRFVSWQQMTELIESAGLQDLEPFVRQLIEQYIEFMRRPKRSAGGILADDAVFADASVAIREIIQAIAVGRFVTVIDLWSAFESRYPDHVTALNGRYADTSKYSAKSWFAATIQRMAARRDMLDDTGEWCKADARAWSYPKVRIYRRIVE